MKLLFGIFALATLGCRAEALEQPSCGATGDAARVLRKGLGVAGQAVKIGIVGDASEALPATLANLERFAGVFRREKVAAIVFVGGLGSTEEEIAKILSALKPADVPVFALPGESEPMTAMKGAIARAKKAGVEVVDLSEKRAIRGEGLAILSLPGYRDGYYVATGGCRYRAPEVAALKDLAAWLASGDGEPPLLIVAHAPPRGSGPLALDWALGGANVGDPELAKILPSLKARVGAFGHVVEAGGRGWDGQAPLAEGAWAEQLYVNAGAADAVPHELSKGGAAHGQAVLVEIADGKARFRVMR